MALFSFGRGGAAVVTVARQPESVTAVSQRATRLGVAPDEDSMELSLF
jgi:hypothetical protein